MSPPFFLAAYFCTILLKHITNFSVFQADFPKKNPFFPGMPFIDPTIRTI